MAQRDRPLSSKGHNTSTCGRMAQQGLSVHGEKISYRKKEKVHRATVGMARLTGSLRVVIWHSKGDRKVQEPALRRLLERWSG